MDLSTAAGLEALARDTAALLGAQRAEQGNTPGRARIVYADGRALELAPNRPHTKITVSAVLPEQAAAQGLAVEPITLTAQPRPGPGETQDEATARHTADHIRRRLLPYQHGALFWLSPAVGRARTALSALPDRPAERWAITDVPVPRPQKQDQRCAIAWWHTPTGESRAVAPFIADMLRRAGLVTTEPHGSGHVFFAEPPAEQPDARIHVTPAAQDGWDLVDQLTGATVRTYDDAEWAQGIAEGANREYEAARRAGTVSLDLPGLWFELIDKDEFRSLAVELATSGHMPYGLLDVDYTQTPGFLIFGGSEPGVARVARLLEPWGSLRPGDRLEAPAHEAERFDRDLEAYARVLEAPGRTVSIAEHAVRVTFDPAPSMP
ncbi:hypothetical protein ABZ379_45500 [Streptomyces canus]|uniref:hypothetical protein n=1 Tax=Streptomyces canus TaxID=58343 RepID=UPI0033DA7ABD